MNEWYCRLFGQELGPMSQDDLILLAKKGNLRRDTLVCRGAERVWLPASQFQGIFAEERREQTGRFEPPARRRPRDVEKRVRNVRVAAATKKPPRETSRRRRSISLPSIAFPSLPWLKALAILVTIAGIAGAGTVAYQAAGTTSINHQAIAQELERYFAEVQGSREARLDYVAAAMLQGRLRAQINALRVPLRNAATGTLEATLDAAADSVLTMAEYLAVAKSPASEQAIGQKADEFQRLIAQAKQSTSSS